MNDPDGIIFFDLLAGAVIICAILVRSWLARIGVPSLVGFLVVGFVCELRMTTGHSYRYTGRR